MLSEPASFQIPTTFATAPSCNRSPSQTFVDRDRSSAPVVFGAKSPPRCRTADRSKCLMKRKPNMDDQQHHQIFSIRVKCGSSASWMAFKLVGGLPASPASSTVGKLNRGPSVISVTYCNPATAPHRIHLVYSSPSHPIRRALT